MSDIIFQTQENPCDFQTYIDNPGLMPSDITWNGINEMYTIHHETYTIYTAQQDGPGPMLRGGVLPPTQPAPITDSIVPLLFMAGVFSLIIYRINRTRKLKQHISK